MWEFAVWKFAFPGRGAREPQSMGSLPQARRIRDSFSQARPRGADWVRNWVRIGLPQAIGGH